MNLDQALDTLRGRLVEDPDEAVQAVLDHFKQQDAGRDQRGLSPVSIWSDAVIPNGFQLTNHSEVVFDTGTDPDPARRESLSMSMPRTRDQGWVEVSSDPFTDITSRIRYGHLFLKAVPR